MASITKNKIIEQTFKLLLHKGYDGVSITDIQNYMNISRGLIYHYFGSKESLFMEAAKHNFTALFQIDLELIKEYNASQMCDYIVKKYQNFTDNTLLDIPIINYDFLYYRIMQEAPELAALYQRVRDDELQGWKVSLRNTKQQGKMREGIDIDKMAQQFVYITDGVWMKAVTPAVEIDLNRSLKEALETLISIIS